MKYMIKTIIVNVLLLLSVSVFSQVKNNQLKIQGEAVLYETPEILIVNIPIHTKDSVYEECSNRLIYTYDKLKWALSEKGIKEELIRTDRFNIQENYTWTSNQRKFDGYVGNLNVTIELEYTVKTLNTIINVLNKDSFNFGYNLNFKLSEIQKSTLLEKVIDLAIKDATNKARIIANSLNVKLSEIKEVNFGYTSTRYDLLIVEDDMELEVLDSEVGGNKLSLNPQQLSIRKSIGVVWLIEQ